MDARLGRGVALDLASWIGFRGDRLDRGPLGDRGLRPGCAACDRGVDHGAGQTRLAAERAIDGLDRDPGLRRERRHRDAPVAVRPELRAGRRDDVAPGLGHLFRTPGGAIGAPGLDVVGHFVRMILARNRLCTTVSVA